MLRNDPYEKIIQTLFTYEQLTELDQKTFAQNCLDTNIASFYSCIKDLIENYYLLLLDWEASVEEIQLFGRLKKLTHFLKSSSTETLHLSKEIASSANQSYLQLQKEIEIQNTSLVAQIKVDLMENVLQYKKSIDDELEFMEERKNTSEQALQEMQELRIKKQEASNCFRETVLSSEKSYKRLSYLINIDPKDYVSADIKSRQRSFVYFEQIQYIDNLLQEVNNKINDAIKTVKSLSKNTGIIRIEHALSICTNLLFSTPFSNLTDHNLYYKIAICLAEFWFNERDNLLIDQDQKEALTSTSTNDKNIYALSLFFISNVNESNDAYRQCLMDIVSNLSSIKFSSAEKFQFSLKSFALNHPDRYREFYSYLLHSNETELFRQFISSQLENNQTLYRVALFKLYDTLSYAIIYNIVYPLDENNPFTPFFIASCKKTKDFLLLAYNNGIVEAEKELLDHYSNDLDVLTTLASAYFDNKQTKKFSINEEIFFRIKEKPENDVDLSQHHFLTLFRHWMGYPNLEIRKFSAFWLCHFAKQQNIFAYNILKTLSRENENHAALFIDVVISLNSHLENKPNAEQVEYALSILNNHIDKEGCIVPYCIYRLKFLKDKTRDHTLLVKAANLGNSLALSELSDLAYSAHEDLRSALYQYLLTTMHRSSPNLIELLKDLFLKKLLLPSHLTNLRQIVREFFYKQLLISSDRYEKTIELLKAYALEGNDQIIYPLTQDAKKCYANCIFLINMLLTHSHYKNGNFFNVLGDLKNILNKHHADNTSSEKCYYLYMIKKNNGMLDMLGLKILLEAEYQKAFLEAMIILNDPTSMCVYSNYLEMILVSLLNRIQNNACKEIATQALCLYYIRENDVEKSNQYFHQCLQINNRIDDICNLLQAKNKIKKFLILCDAETFKKIPAIYKRESKVKAQIRFFEKNIQQSAAEEKQENSSLKQKKFG